MSGFSFFMLRFLSAAKCREKFSGCSKHSVVLPSHDGNFNDCVRTSDEAPTTNMVVRLYDMMNDKQNNHY